MDDLTLSRSQRRAKALRHLDPSTSAGQDSAGGHVDREVPGFPAKVRGGVAAAAAVAAAVVVAVVWLVEALVFGAVTGWVFPAVLAVAAAAAFAAAFWLLRPGSSTARRLVSAATDRVASGDLPSRVAAKALGGLEPLPQDAAALLRRAGFQVADSAGVTVAATAAGAVVVAAVNRAVIDSGEASDAVAKLAYRSMPVVLLVLDRAKSPVAGALTCTRKDIVRVCQRAASR